MTRKGLEKLKAAYAHEIFKKDLYEIYEKQTDYRNELCALSREKIAEIIRGINGKKHENETLECMLKTLAEKLADFKGKKIYGYLQRRTKNLVNGIVDELMKDNDLQKLYELWCEQRESVLKTYREELPARLPLSANEEFKCVRNAVVAEALKLTQAEIPTASETRKNGKNPGKDYKTAWEFYRWAKFCSDKKCEEYNPEFAVKLFEEAANRGVTAAKYRLSKIFLNGDGAEKDDAAALEWLKRVATEGNEFAEYALGRIFLFGIGIERNVTFATKYLESAAKHGNEHAEKLLRQKETFDAEQVRLGVGRLFGYICGVLQEKAEAESGVKMMKTDKKLRRQIAEKKQAQGLKLE